MDIIHQLKTVLNHISYFFCLYCQQALGSLGWSMSMLSLLIGLIATSRPESYELYTSTKTNFQTDLKTMNIIHR